MMRKKLHIFCILLALLFVAASCAPQNENGGDVAKNPLTIDFDEYKYEGLHKVDVREGTADLVKNGQTEYKVVIPKEAQMRIDEAILELNNLFYMATELSFEVITDEGLSHSKDNKYISIGLTGLLDECGIEPDFDVLGNSGFIIRTVDNTVFLSGAEGYGFGNIYAVYEFLAHTVNYEFFSPTEIRIEKNVRNLKLPIFDIVEVPDFEWRLAGYENASNNTQLANRYRQHRRGDNSFMSTGLAGRNSHTLEGWFKPELFPDHYKWFSNETNHGDHAHQLCYTAHGDSEEYEALIDETVNYVRTAMTMHPQAALFNLGQADGGGWCSCTSCRAEFEKYGTHAAAVIKWVNRVGEKVDQMIAQEFPGRKFTLSIFAYAHTEKAPAYKDSQGKWHPIDNSVKLRENIAIMYAPIYSAAVLPVNDPRNETMVEVMDAWNACASILYTWFYDTSFNDYLHPYNSYNSMQSKYQAAKVKNSIWIYNQSQYNQVTATGFNTLKMYLDSKLQWNVNLDYTALIDNFFENYFKDAAPAMRKYFEDLRLRFAEIEQDPQYDFNMNYNTLNTKYWPKAMLDRWLGYIDEAYLSIEHYKTSDPELYIRLSDRINLESISIRYMLLELYKGRFDAEELYRQQVDFKNDCTKLGLSRANERNLIDSIWQRWGI